MTGEVRSVFTDTRHGDLMVRTDPSVLAARRAAIVDRPWSWLRQVHGARIVTVTHPGEHAGAEADAAVTAAPGCALVVRTADCAPVWFDGGRVVGIAHAGWKGLEAGVLEATVDALRALGAPSVRATLGPCIHVGCYEFGATELDRLVARYGDGVRGTSGAGHPALDLPAAVGAALDPLGVELDSAPSSCTACGDRRFSSYRARAEASRQASFAWLDA